MKQGNNNKRIVRASNEDTKVEPTKRSIGIFHKKVYEGENVRFDTVISLDVSIIKNISISRNDGTTLLSTENGVIAVEESFEEANRIWANA